MRLLLDYTGDIEMVGESSIADHIRQTQSRFQNNNDYENYINAIDQDYKSEDAIFNGYICKIKTPQFNLINRSQYGNGRGFKHEIIEYRGNKCFVQTEVYCFNSCINFLTGEDYKQRYQNFVRNGKRRSNMMTKARIQPFCRTNNFNLGYFDEIIRVFPRSVMNRNKNLFLCNNHFCLIWKSENIRFNQAIKKIEKKNIKIVDTFITEGNVDSRFKYVFFAKKE